jgi:hypothetical protein
MWQVFVRIRPFLGREKGTESAILVEGSNVRWHLVQHAKRLLVPFLLSSPRLPFQRACAPFQFFITI